MNPLNAKHTDIELLKLLQRDDQHAFKIIYERHHPRIYQTAFRYLKSADNAQEVVQDVFMKLWMGRKTVTQLLSLEAWIYTMAKNNIANRLKREAVEWKAKALMAAQIHLSEDETFHHLLNKEYAHILQEVIADLPEQQKMVFKLARLEKLSYVEIGEKLKISPLTVKTHMSRALQEIRRNLSQRGIEIPAILFFLKNFF